MERGQEVKDFQCDKCHKDISIFQVGYMGPEDGSDECNPFMSFTTLCRGCEKKNPHFKSGGEVGRN